MFGQRHLSAALRTPTAAEILIFAVLGFFVYGVVTTAQRWTGGFTESVAIDLSLSALPTYVVYSLFRGLIAYMISLIFSLIVGYAAAKSRAAERIILPLLDIGQSIPVLGFLPSLVLGLITLFPSTNIGLELACVLMFFTSQTWNLAFAFYASLKEIPTPIKEMGRIVGMSRMRRLFSIEMPFTSTALAWNSLVSIAGGWFFLTVCESFTLGETDFHLPGLGSYISAAIDQQNRTAIAAGLLSMLAVIVVMDFLIWRPIIAWTGRFQADHSQTGDQEIPFISLMLRESRVVQAVVSFVVESFRRYRIREATRQIKRADAGPSQMEERLRKLRRWWRRSPVLRRAAQFLLTGVFSLFVFWVIGRLYTLLSPLGWSSWALVLKGALLTCLRVFVALALATLWTVPVGILIGLSPRLTRALQPVIQVAASFPAPMLYPIILATFAWLGIGLGTASIFLMLFGMQWYVLFNVLAGAMKISDQVRQDFRLHGMRRRDYWWGLYIPSIFPSLVTGWVTAAGGAWNASVVAEYVRFRGANETTLGLGSIISQATAKGDYSLLCAGLLVMIVTVVGLNRTLWRRLYDLAESRYRFDR